MSADPLSLFDPARGSYQTESAAGFTARAVAAGERLQHTAVNCIVKEDNWYVRHRVIEHEISGDDAAAFKAGNVQAALWYNPKLGQGTHYIDTGIPRLVVSVAGRLYALTIGARGATCEDVSGPFTALPEQRICWMAQGENYVVRTDYGSLTQIYDGKITIGTPGYNQNQPTSSRFPNYAGPLTYASGSFWVTRGAGGIVQSDYIHTHDREGATDILKFEQQGYDINDVEFSPPTNEGNILALSVLNGHNYDISRAQDYVLVWCDGPASWGVQLGIQRALYATTKMRRNFSLVTGASGPYAGISTGDGNITFRSIYGINSLRLIAGDGSALSTAPVNLAQELRPLLDLDAPEWLLFASVASPMPWERYFCTVSPVVDGLNRYHRGWISAALNPDRGRSANQMLWEGIGVLPEAMGKVIQFIHAHEFGSDRLFALTRKPDGTNGLVEFTREFGDDELADGTPVPIKWQLLTRRLAPHGEYNRHSWGMVNANVWNVRDRVKLAVYSKDAKRDDCFTLHRECCVQNVDWCPQDCPQEPRGLADTGRPIWLEKPFQDSDGAAWLQVLVKGEGSCGFDMAIGGMSNGTPDEQGSCPVDLCGRCSCDFNPFESNPDF